MGGEISRVVALNKGEVETAKESANLESEVDERASSSLSPLKRVSESGSQEGVDNVVKKPTPTSRGRGRVVDRTIETSERSDRLKEIIDDVITTKFFDLSIEQISKGYYVYIENVLDALPTKELMEWKASLPQQGQTQVKLCRTPNPTLAQLNPKLYPKSGTM